MNLVRYCGLLRRDSPVLRSGNSPSSCKAHSMNADEPVIIPAGKARARATLASWPIVEDSSLCSAYHEPVVGVLQALSSAPFLDPRSGLSTAQVLQRYV